MIRKKIDTRLDSLPLGQGLTASNTYVFARRVRHYPVKWWIYRRGILFHAFELRGEKLFSLVKKWRRQEGEPLSRRRQTQSRPNAVDDSSIVSFAPESISLFHVPFFLFFPFRHLLPRENCTIRGGGRPLKTPTTKMDHSDLNCCFVTTHLEKMDMDIAGEIHQQCRGLDRRCCQTRFGQFGSTTRRATRGGGMFSHTTYRLRAGEFIEKVEQKKASLPWSDRVAAPRPNRVGPSRAVGRHRKYRPGVSNAMQTNKRGSSTRFCFVPRKNLAADQSCVRRRRRRGRRRGRTRR